MLFDKVHTSKQDIETIVKIARRAVATAKNNDIQYDQMTAVMDLEYVHSINPLRLNDLLNADDFNFNHDIFGIRGNLNRQTGKIENCFSPRYTA
jgi:hypothetical protein